MTFGKILKYLLIFVFISIIAMILFKIPKIRENMNINRGDNKITELKENIKSVCSVVDNSDDLMHQVCKKIDDMNIYQEKQSYTINKENIYLCLYDKNNKYYSNNMLMYVLLHELAHTICKSVGHTPEFHSIFDRLLQQASKIGLYDPSIPIDEDYCKHNA